MTQELKDIGVRKFSANFSGIAPTLDSGDSINPGDIAVDTSVTPPLLWVCVKNTVNYPIWKRLIGEYKVITTAIANYITLYSDEVILINTSALSSNQTTTLLDATLYGGQCFTFKLVNATHDAVITPKAGSGQLIDDAATLTLSGLNAYVKIISDDTNWKIINSS